MVPGMSSPRRDQTTAILAGSSDGDATIDAVFPAVYQELRDMAARFVARESRNATLNPTALVHETYLRLVDTTRVTARGRAYFFAAAAQAMRRILVDAARRRGAQKRGAGEASVTLPESLPATEGFAAELLELDAALARLADAHPREARVVELRFFGGMRWAEVAEVLDVSERTAKRDWSLARAWLHRELDEPGTLGMTES